MPKKKFANCPCCRNDRHETEVRTCLAILEKYERNQFKYYEELKVNSYGSLIKSNFDWACDECLNKNKAILANPFVQQSFFSVNLAYFDQQCKCRQCGMDFTFSKDEKRKWYETYQFHPDSIPEHCFTCRKEIRQLKAENKFLSEMLAKEKSDVTVAQWKTVVEIYTRWGKLEKAKFYQSKIKK